METGGKILVFAMGVTFMLLAYQVPTNVTSVLGWCLGHCWCWRFSHRLRKSSAWTKANDTDNDKL